MKNISAIICGLLFGFGLVVSGMTDTQKVIGFLNVFGQWVPDLMLVMGSAVLTTGIGYKVLFKQRNTPLFSDYFSLPKTSNIDYSLLLGAALFGIGWGLYGYCPGPAIASIIYLSPVTFVFIATMVLGLFLGSLMSNKMKAAL